MKQLTTDLRGIARIAVAALPTPLADLMRGAKRALLNARSPKDVFTRIAECNEWDGTESVSGPGSTLEATRLLREALPGLLDRYEIRSFLDVPCGDAYWITQVLPEGITYFGGDIVPVLIEKARAEKGDFGTFAVMDLVTDDLPKVDLVMVRDCFIHLPNATVKRAIANIKRSGATWLLTTHFVDVKRNIDIEIGGYRPVNLRIAPFLLPEPEMLLNDFDGVNENGKHMALWRLMEL